MCNSRLGDIEICDFSDSETDVSFDVRAASGSHPIKTFSTKELTNSEIRDLKILIFGNTSSVFDTNWQQQSFIFDKNIPYGLHQHKGGPCGLLAAVQAHFLRKLLFQNTEETENPRKLPVKFEQLNGQHSTEHFSSKLIHVSEDRKRSALIQALSDILWEAGDKTEAVIVTSSFSRSTGTRIQLYRDGPAEMLSLTRFTRLENIEIFFTERYKELENEGSCICFLYSAILTRGFDRIRKDMDDATNCLMGRHGYCTQEMVNLLLIGQAVSNVFDNDICLSKSKDSQGLLLKGIKKPSNIGFLSLFEHYDSCQVGDFFKCPHFPIWVVLSESHFTVLFAQDQLPTEKTFGQMEQPWQPFQLFYYDTLGKQDCEICLTIMPPGTNMEHSKVIHEEIISPIEHCIRTKWKKANISWQGSDPLL